MFEAVSKTQFATPKAKATVHKSYAIVRNHGIIAAAAAGPSWSPASLSSLS